MYYIQASKNWVVVYKQNLIEVTLDLFIAFRASKYWVLVQKMRGIFSSKYHFLNAIFTFWHAFQCKNGVKVLL